MKKLIISIALMLIHFSAVAESSPSPSPDRWKKTVKITSSEFDTEIRFTGKEFTSGRLYGYPEKSWQLVSLMNKKTGHTDHYIEFHDSYQGSWRRWEYASTDSAEELNVISISRDVGNCSGGSCLLYEVIAIPLKGGRIDKLATSGGKIRVGAENGEKFVIEIDKSAAEDQINAVSDYTKSDDTAGYI